MIKVTLYNQTKTFDSKSEALAFFKEGMNCCDPNSHEFARYEYAYYEILGGRENINTDMEDY